MGEWAHRTDAIERPGYRISQDGPPERPWRLELPAGMFRARPPVLTHHASLRLAMDRAEHDEAIRLRRIAAGYHFAIAAAATIASAFLAPHMGSLVVLAVASAAFYLAIRSFGNGLAAWLSEAWGWTRPDRRRPFVLERFVMWFARRVWVGVLSARAKRAAPIVVGGPGDDAVQPEPAHR